MNKTDSSHKVFTVLAVMETIDVKSTNGDLEQLRQKQASRQSNRLVWSTADKDSVKAHAMANELVTDDLQEKARLMRQARKIKR